MKVLTRTVLLVLLGITLINCGYAAGETSAKKKSTVKGARGQMNTYRIGRFAMDVPAEFKVVHREHEFRLVGIEEFTVPDPRVSVQCAERKWKERLDEIKKLDKPRGVKEIVIKQQTFEGLGHWAKGILYYHDYMTVRRGRWEIWVDYGRQLTVFKLMGLISAQESMLSWMMEVVRAYRPIATAASVGKRPFRTALGEINLPYKRQESTSLRFEDSRGVVFRVKMNDTQMVVKSGVLERLAASIQANFAPHVKSEELRARKRYAAGLPGEEIIARLSDKDGTELFLGWEYPGKENSGEHPEIRIAMEECPPMAEGDMVAIWDRMLNSFKSGD